MPEGTATGPAAELHPAVEDEVVDLGVGGERGFVGAEAELVGDGDEAAIAEGVDEEVEGLEIAGGGGAEEVDGGGGEAGGGEAGEEGAEGGGGGIGGEEGEGEGEVEVLGEDV